MIEDCKAGKIDMIITKSISRFARNTMDTLNYVRMLKELGISVKFEKENIETLESKGEALLQKTYTVDFLLKKRVENKGEVAKYYVEESQPPTVDRDTWEAVQLERERRKTLTEKYNIQKMDYVTYANPFAGRIICDCCGGVYGRKVWNSNNERLKRTVWQCNNKYAIRGKKGCDNKHITDEVFYRVICKCFCKCF